MVKLDPTANLDDFDSVPGLRDAWSTMLGGLIDVMNYGPLEGSPTVLDELKLWGGSDADIRFFNPLSMPTPPKSEEANVTWRALPTSFDSAIPNTKKRYQFLDDQHLDPSDKVMTRVQDEYNEWKVIKNEDGKIVRVLFTSEPAAYYNFLSSPPTGIDRKLAQSVLLELYREACGQDVPIGDLLDGSGRYNPYNKWNGEFAVHMQQVNNTLGAQVNIAARSAILRLNTVTGQIKTDAQELIECARYGAGERQSDPAIGAAVNMFVRANKFIKLQNPIGLYMTGLDTEGWTSPDGTDPQTFWTPIRGEAGPVDKARIVRAIFEVPADKNYTVSDVKIGGKAIQFGAEIAAHIGMRLGVTVGPESNLPKPRPIGCLGEIPPVAALKLPSVFGTMMRSRV